jgi:acetylornithine aminotransferase
LVDHVRGAGLLLGIGLTDPVAARVADQARADGFLVNVPRPDTIRLAPPLVLTTEQARTFVTALPGILDRAGQDAVVTDPAVTS